MGESESNECDIIFDGILDDFGLPIEQGKNITYQYDLVSVKIEVFYLNI